MSFQNMYLNLQTYVCLIISTWNLFIGTDIKDLVTGTNSE